MFDCKDNKKSTIHIIYMRQICKKAINFYISYVFFMMIRQ